MGLAFSHAISEETNGRADQQTSNTPRVNASAQAGVISGAGRAIRQATRSRVESFKSWYAAYRDLPRMIEPGKTGKERVINNAKWLGSFGLLNGLRTRWRHARYTTEPIDVVPAGTYALDLSAREPSLIPAGAMPFPNVRHVQLGQFSPGDDFGDWSHLLMSGIFGRGEDGKSMLFPSKKYSFDPGFSPDARYRRLRISTSDPDRLAEVRKFIEAELGAGPQRYILGKRTCVTFGCDALRPLFADPDMKLPLRARWNGGTMQRYFYRNREKIFADGVTVDWVEPALVARKKTRGPLGPAIDWFLGRPGFHEEGFAYRRLGLEDFWEQNRVIRREPKFEKPPRQTVEKKPGRLSQVKGWFLRKFHKPGLQSLGEPRLEHPISAGARRTDRPPSVETPLIENTSFSGADAP